MNRRSGCNEIVGPGGALAFRREDSAARDLALLIEGETSGRDLEEVLLEFGCSRSTYYEKLRRFRAGGIEALLPRPPGPRGPWRRTFDVVRAIVTARLRNPSRSAASIAEQLARDDLRISPRSVERTLAQFGLTRSRSRLGSGGEDGE
ncbi:MAG: helix-turn-helix domain-containing protein [Myxococcales bacterium]|nr:helix-turn-helix domain-containing protein [Myxococcales bacterium]